MMVPLVLLESMDPEVSCGDAREFWLKNLGLYISLVVGDD